MEMDEEEIIKQFGAETLFGDVRDAILSQVRSMQDPWSKLPEEAQQSRIELAEKTAEHVVRQALSLIAKAGFDNMAILVKDFQVKGGVVKGKFETNANHNNVMLLSDHQESRAVLVLADPDKFMGQAAEAKPDPDAPELPIEDDAGDMDEAA
jgi:hypothetical protein